MEKLLYKLCGLADKLDASGKHDAANQVDATLIRFCATQQEIEAYNEFQERREQERSTLNQLEELFEYLAKHPDPDELVQAKVRLRGRRKFIELKLPLIRIRITDPKLLGLAEGEHEETLRILKEIEDKYL